MKKALMPQKIKKNVLLRPKKLDIKLDIVLPG